MNSGVRVQCEVAVVRYQHTHDDLSILNLPSPPKQFEEEVVSPICVYMTKATGAIV